MKKFTSFTKFAKSITLLTIMALSALTAMAQEPSEAYAPANANDWWTGEVASNNKLAYIYNVGAGIFLSGETPTVTDINNAEKWNMQASGEAYTFSNTYRIYMESALNVGVTWTTKISTTDNATAFVLAEGTTQDRGTAYKLSKTPSLNSTRFFNIDGNKYTAAKSESANNDFLFISDVQKNTYDEYTTLFQNAANYLNNEYIKKSETASKALIDALKSAAAGKYNTYSTDKETLNNAIQAAKSFIKDAANSWWRGEEVADGKTAYLFNVGAGTFVTNDVASETEIDNADLWTIKKSTSTFGLSTYYSFTSSNNYKLHMESDWKFAWSTSVSTTDAATKFSLENGESTNIGTVYKFSNSYVGSKRYFNVDGEKYTAAVNTSAANDFIFISEEQKKKFDNYETLYDKAYELRFNEKIEESEEMTAMLTDALNKTAKGSYASYNEDKDTLEKAIKAAEEFITPTDINKIENGTNAQATAIYDLNGVRKNQLTKGFNIVKMTDGKVKKVLVK